MIFNHQSSLWPHLAQFSGFHGGTHDGEFSGIAPTHRKVSFSGMSFVAVSDGKITEGWDCRDFNALVTTLSSPSA